MVLPTLPLQHANRVRRQPLPRTRGSALTALQNPKTRRRRRGRQSVTLPALHPIGAPAVGHLRLPQAPSSPRSAPASPLSCNTPAPPRLAPPTPHSPVPLLTPKGSPHPRLVHHGLRRDCGRDPSGDEVVRFGRRPRPAPPRHRPCSRNRAHHAPDPSRAGHASPCRSAAEASVGVSQHRLVNETTTAPPVRRVGLPGEDWQKSNQQYRVGNGRRPWRRRR